MRRSTESGEITVKTIYLLLISLAILLTACQPCECEQTKKDLAASQTYILYLTCLDVNPEELCNQALCEKYPDAVVCIE